MNIFSVFFERRKAWNIGFRNKGISELLKKAEIDNISWFGNLNRRTFVSDPIPFSYQEKQYIFVEEYDFDKEKGHISVIEKKDGAFLKPVKIIDEPFHMSYPFVFEENGEIYCVPETCGAGNLFLYKCIKFPEKWKRELILLKEKIGDPTLYKHNGFWWLFCTKLQNGKENTDLYLYYSESINGEWIPHLKNPVKSDIKSSRPAGALFSNGSALFRPAQNCTEKYGQSVIINRITELNKENYREEFFSELGPVSNSVYNDGLHTLSFMNGMTIIDGRKKIILVTSFRAILRSLYHSFVKMFGKLRVLIIYICFKHFLI